MTDTTGTTIRYLRSCRIFAFTIVLVRVLVPLLVAAIAATAGVAEVIAEVLSRFVMLRAVPEVIFQHSYQMHQLSHS